MTQITIKEATGIDLEDVLFVERSAFGSDEEANLVRELLKDNTAQPSLSLLALKNNQPVGHILFTHAYLDPVTSISISLLAPLAVIPVEQKKGIGGQLIQHGLDKLKKSNISLIFVLGHPSYYPRHGFKPAFPLGLKPPYPITPEQQDAWMVNVLNPEVVGKIEGTVRCAAALNHPHYWIE